MKPEMAAPRGGMDTDTLFGKYRLLRPAGSGRTGTVWLAVHEGLEEYRAIKRVAKSEVDYETFRREALILKELKHPGMPMVYDLEEDSDYFYLIEEYLEGDSLYALIKERGVLEGTEALRLGVQLCSLVEYMHSACEQPILHLDLQPNNLIVNGGTVRLIDFGSAAGRSDANGQSMRLGTRGWAAPEQYTFDRLLDSRTDIYAIGAVLRFMICGTEREGTDKSPETRLERGLDRVIRRCMAPEQERRFASAREAGEAMEALLAGKEGEPFEFGNRAAPSLTIALTANRPGAGATHLGLGLCAFLTRRGVRVLYEEGNDSRALRRLIGDGGRPDRFGVFHVKGCRLRPWYGPAAGFERLEDFSVVLEDLGAAGSAGAGGRKADLILAVVSENLWERGLTKAMLESLEREPETPVFLILRHADRAWAGALGRLGVARLFRAPEYADPFAGGREAESFFESLWQAAQKEWKSRGKAVTGWGRSGLRESRERAEGRERPIWRFWRRTF